MKLYVCDSKYIYTYNNINFHHLRSIADIVSTLLFNYIGDDKTRGSNERDDHKKRDVATLIFLCVVGVFVT